jgi:two-component system OmpR family response regulator
MEKYKILVVDDDQLVLDMLKDNLGMLGYQVETAEDEAGLKRAIDKSVPDVIMLDVRLPGLDGISLCRNIRRSSKTAHIPVIIMTGLADRVTFNDARLFGASAFLNKPFEFDQVRKTLDECIAGAYAKRGKEK